MKLFCLPYAGASGTSFLKLKKYLDADIEMLPLDPPGRGRRISEPAYLSVTEAVDDMAKQFLEMTEKEEEYAIYAHSLGCLLAYELMYKLQSMNISMPAHVFLSGKNAPDVPPCKIRHNLSDSKFIKEMQRLGGTNPEFFQNETLMKIYFPILRADFQMLETYHYPTQAGRQKLPVDVSFFFSSEDDVISKKRVEQWKNFITGSFYLYSFKGGHFFIFDEGKNIMDIINNTLLKNQYFTAY